MKKIGKLSINPEKVIKNEELVNLKGGMYFALCYDENDQILGNVILSGECEENQPEYETECDAAYGEGNVAFAECYSTN